MSNSSDPDQARHFVGPDLGPNCLQRLSVGKDVLDTVFALILILLSHLAENPCGYDNFEIHCKIVENDMIRLEKIEAL